MAPEETVTAGMPSPGTKPVRVSIDHNYGLLLVNDFEIDKDVSSRIISLGVIRNRVMFSGEYGSGSSTLECSSKDGENGFPTIHFPVGESAFTDDFAIQAKDAVKSGEYNGDKALPCASCNFRKWEKDPLSSRKSKRPRCTLQMVIPMLIPPKEKYSMADVLRHTAAYDKMTPSERKEKCYTLGVAYYQKSAEGPAADFVNAFAKMKMPMYSCLTILTHKVNLGSGFRYSVPQFKMGEKTPETFHPLLSRMYKEVIKELSDPRPPPPLPRPSGGMLSVAAEEPLKTYTGSFFS